MPGLHISLGIFYRLFTLLETEAHKLDLELAQHSNQADTLHSYRVYSEAVHKLTELRDTLATQREEADAAEQLATYLAVRGMSSTQIEYCRQAASSLWKEIAELVSKQKLAMTQHTLHVLQLNFQESEIRKQESVVKKGFTSEEGPFTNSLDKALSSFNVERQAYYGGTFVGNHVHRSLKVYMYTNPYCYDKFLHVYTFRLYSV